MAQILFKGDYSQIILEATKTRAEVEKIFAKGVSLKIDTQALSTLDEATLKTLRTVTQYVSAVAKATAAEARMAAEARKTAAAEERKAAATAKETQAIRQLAVVQQQAVQAEASLSQSITVGNTALVSRISLMQQMVSLYNQMQGQFGGQKLLEGNAIFGSGISGSGGTKSSPIIDVDWTPVEKGAEEAAQSVANYAKILKDTGLQQNWFTDLMGDSFGRVTAKMALWQVMGNAISTVMGSFKEAIATMKEVDAELANIEKVSGMSTSQLQMLADTAYDVASAYGVAAQDYLSAVATFSKAGYDDLSQSLGELAIKTQLVGDVNADMASKMLLAVDAAYQMKGSQEQLSDVLDKMNYVENNFSTSIEKLTEGMPIVASVASQANMSVEELIATLGTITSVTQETGSKAATAWRALVLNIFGEVGAEIEEGEEVTVESVESLNDALWKYARSAMEAAEATGTIVDPMEAIGALHQSMKDGLLTEAELFSMLSSLGGKLRTNQLVALVENFDMVQEMLAGMGQAAGSADKELSVMLDTWNAKTEQLKNTWTKFVSGLVETDQVKDVLDELIGIVGSLDTDAAAAAIQIGLLATGVSAISHTTTVQWFKAFFATITTGSAAANSALAMLTSTMLASPLFWGTVVVGGIYLIKKATEDYGKSIDELNGEIESSNEKIDENRQRLEEINRIPWNERTSEILAERDALERENDELTQQIEKYNELKKRKAEYTLDNASGVKTTYSEQRIKGEIVSTPTTTIVSGDEFFHEQTEKLKEYQNILEKNHSLNDEQLKDYRSLISESRKYVQAIDNLENGIDDATPAQRGFYEAYRAVQQAMEDAPKYIDTYVNGLIEHQNATGAAKDKIYELVKAEITLNEQGLDLSEQIQALMTLGTIAGGVAESIALIGNVSTRDVERTIRGYLETGAANSYDEAKEMALDSIYHSMFTKTSLTPDSSGKKKKKTSDSTKDPELERLKEVVKLKKSELELMQAQGRPAEEQADKMREIQAALHQQAEYMRSVGAAQSEINELSSEWYDWNEKILDLQKKLWNELQNAITEKLKDQADARDEEIAKIDAEIEALKKQKELADNTLELEEKKAAVLEKQKALLDAQNERTVRTFNSATGQWEWQANAKTVKDAQDAYEKAKDDLSKFKDDLERDARIDELEAEKKKIKAKYDDLESQWDKIIAAMAEPVRSITDILKDIADNATPELKRQILENKELFQALGIDVEELSDEFSKSAILSRMQRRSDLWWQTSDKEQRDILHDQNLQDANALGLTIGEDGAYYWPDGTLAYQTELQGEAAQLNKNGLTVDQIIKIISESISGALGNISFGSNTSGSGGGGNNGGGSGSGGGSNGNFTGVSSDGGTYDIGSDRGKDFVNNAEAGDTMTGSDGSTWVKNSDGTTTISKNGNTYTVYDTGGVLHGLGGIKATTQDELILPPDVTAKMLDPDASPIFQQRLNELRWLYQKGQSVSATTEIERTVNNRDSHDHYGNNYSIAGIHLGKAQSAGMTLEQLVEASKTLGIFGE